MAEVRSSRRSRRRITKWGGQKLGPNAMGMMNCPLCKQPKGGGFVLCSNCNRQYGKRKVQRHRRERD